MIEWRDGSIILPPEERAFWLHRFGSSEVLELALIQAAGDCIPNPRSFVPYTSRVRSVLARIAMGKIARDAKYGRAPPDSAQRAPLWRTTPDGSKRYVRGSPGFEAVLERLRQIDPEEARAVDRRGWVWVSYPQHAGNVADRIMGRLTNGASAAYRSRPDTVDGNGNGHGAAAVQNHAPGRAVRPTAPPHAPGSPPDGIPFESD